MAEIKLIKMIRPFADVEPKEADVHPSMVEDYKQGGWILADSYDVKPEPDAEAEEAEEIGTVQKPKRSKKVK